MIQRHLPPTEASSCSEHEGQASQRSDVSILLNRRCCGSTYPTDLEARLKKHKEGGVPNTAKSKPWRLETAIAFRSESKARAFDHYLKSVSGVSLHGDTSSGTSVALHGIAFAG